MYKMWLISRRPRKFPLVHFYELLCNSSTSTRREEKQSKFHLKLPSMRRARKEKMETYVVRVVGGFTFLYSYILTVVIYNPYTSFKIYIKGLWENGRFFVSFPDLLVSFMPYVDFIVQRGWLGWVENKLISKKTNYSVVVWYGNSCVFVKGFLSCFVLYYFLSLEVDKSYWIRKLRLTFEWLRFPYLLRTC